MEGNQMYIEIDNHRVRRHDKLNFAVEKKKGEEWSHVGWYSFFDAALTGLLQYLIEDKLPQNAEEWATIAEEPSKHKKWKEYLKRFQGDTEKANGTFRSAFEMLFVIDVIQEAKDEIMEAVK